MSSASKSYLKPIVQSLLLIGLIGMIAWLQISRPRLLSDWIISQQFHPSTEALDIRASLDLTPSGNRVFLASQPELNSALDFNQNCARKEASVAILGCYADYRIFVYDVNNQELDGILETTMAHEFLHAAYDRLSSVDRQRVGSLIEADYLRLKTDELEKRLDFYRRTEPGQSIKELHSILGTEFADLSPELEVYYQRYFNDRQLILASYNRYHAKFIDLYQQSEVTKVKIDELEPTILATRASYDLKLTGLNADIARFNEQANNGSIARYQFNTDRSNLLFRVNQLESMRLKINSDVDLYNQLIQNYNSNASRYNELSSSLNSLDPGPSL